MYQPLVPCPACSRHLRATETQCPFCNASLSADLRNAVVPGATQRLGRAATFAFASGLALAGCSDAVHPSDASSNDTVASGDTGASADTSVVDTLFEDRGTPTDTVEDRGNSFPPYGIAPPDSGTPDGGGFQTMYGGPPRDGG